MLMKMPALKNLSAFEDAQGNIEEVQYSSKMLIMESVSAFDEHVRDFPLRHRTRAALEGISKSDVARRVAIWSTLNAEADS